MRKLKLQMQMSLDGFVSTGPNDEQKWVTWALDDIYPQRIIVAKKVVFTTTLAKSEWENTELAKG